MRTVQSTEQWQKPTGKNYVQRMCLFKARKEKYDMKKRTPVVAAGFLVVFAIALMGCGSKDTAESQDTSKTQTTSQAQTTYGRAVEKARETAAALSNPKEGIDPVCGMAIDENAVIVTIDGKDYGCCSAHCAEQLKAEPEKYLVAAADGQGDH
jgi:YHS domain-containing protein